MSCHKRRRGKFWFPRGHAGFVAEKWESIPLFRIEDERMNSDQMLGDC